MKTVGTVAVTGLGVGLGALLYFVLQNKAYEDRVTCVSLTKPPSPVCVQKLDCNAAQIAAMQDESNRSIAACDQKNWLRFTIQEDEMMLVTASVFAIAGGIGGYAASRKL
jgi:hypothetical protein